ncbi:DUF962 domain-containing protein [Candidatus Frankia alpina]|uniref:DUF962 domain-containing protein n=1 Tax=Candidatus Frankia alpina TaxID=2699483 RepID=A0A4S5ECQ6_9ACTN|nr:DUF962 domain-containing protein [Candidatus Frankia alpina]THJ69596.1 DUF962 domain-containing protein [Candidatus Frankia alpina]
MNNRRGTRKSRLAGEEVPDRAAPFAEKMAYYRSQHTGRAIRLSHLVGIPGVAFALPVVLVRPRIGLPVFAASWAVQVAGHVLFEHNRPALTEGPLTYQLCGLAFWCEEVADLVGGRGLGGVGDASPVSRAAASGPRAAGPGSNRARIRAARPLRAPARRPPPG